MLLRMVTTACWTILSSRAATPERALSPVGFLDVNPSRWLHLIRSTVDSVVQVNKSTFQSGFILQPPRAVHSGCGFPL